MKHLLNNWKAIFLLFAILAATHEVVFSQAQSVDLSADSRYEETLDTYNGTYPGTGYTAYIQSQLSVGALSGTLPANRISWRISSQGYFNIPGDLPATFTSNGVTWSKTYYYYDITDGPSSEVRYENTTPVPNNYEGSFVFEAKTARETPGNAQVLIAWNTQTIAINGAFDNNQLGNSFDAPITVGPSPLPVTLVSFNVDKEGFAANLAWATTEESNSDFFEIQHSLNAKNWAAVGTVKSHGESNVLRNYTYTHAAPASGTNYYRLRMVDKDATFAYSTIRSLNFEGLAESSVSVFPNPTSDRLYVKNAEINKLKSLTIVGKDGKELIKSPVSTSGVSIKSLQPGLYLVKLLSQDGTLSTHKLVIDK